MSHFQSSQRILVFINSHVGPTPTVITSNQAEEQNARLTPPEEIESPGMERTAAREEEEIQWQGGYEMCV